MAVQKGPESGPRAVALGVLVDYQRRDAYLGPILTARLNSSGLERRDKALVTELVQGVVRMKLTLDRALEPFSKQPLEKLESGVLWALRMAAYQVMFTKIPAYAAVDMSVAAASEVAGKRTVGYVNAVMRAFVQGQEGLTCPDRDTDAVGYLEARYSHPRWIVRMWIDELGLDRAESLCEADNRSPALCVRANLQRCTRAELKSMLDDAGVSCETGRLAPECLLLRGSGPLVELPGYKEGLFSVQDQGAMVVAHVVNPGRGMKVLDLCAAPGGKANHLAELMGNQGRVVSVDVNRARLAMVGETAARLGNSAVESLLLDATGIADVLDERFDRVLIDAPCTGLGTLARKPDARWRRSPGDIHELNDLQRRLLMEGARMVTEGGTLVYSTCTISEAENQAVVTSFLEQNGLIFEPEVVDVPGHEPAPSLQLFPDIDGCDGMFMAAMRRVG